MAGNTPHHHHEGVEHLRHHETVAAAPVAPAEARQALRGFHDAVTQTLQPTAAPEQLRAERLAALPDNTRLIDSYRRYWDSEQYNRDTYLSVGDSHYRIVHEPDTQVATGRVSIRTLTNKQEMPKITLEQEDLTPQGGKRGLTIRRDDKLLVNIAEDGTMYPADAGPDKLQLLDEILATVETLAAAEAAYNKKLTERIQGAQKDNYEQRRFGRERVDHTRVEYDVYQEESKAGAGAWARYHWSRGEVPEPVDTKKLH